MRLIVFSGLLAAAACSGEAMRTKEGCKIYITPELREITDACVASYYAEQARKNGGQVTECRSFGNTVSCTTN